MKNNLKLDQGGLAGSDIAAIMGVSKYKKPIDVWLEKTGRADNSFGNRATEMGHRLEPLVCDWYVDEMLRRYDKTVKLRKVSKPKVKYEFMVANIDRLVSGHKKILEAKSSGFGQFCFKKNSR